MGQPFLPVPSAASAAGTAAAGSGFSRFFRPSALSVAPGQLPRRRRLPVGRHRRTRRAWPLRSPPRHPQSVAEGRWQPPSRRVRRRLERYANSPAMRSSSTRRGCTLLSASTTHTISPVCPGVTAFGGTASIFDFTASVSDTTTVWPDHTSRSGIGDRRLGTNAGGREIDGVVDERKFGRHADPLSCPGR